MDPTTLSMLELASALEARTLSSVDAVFASLKQIERLHGQVRIRLKGQQEGDSDVTAMHQDVSQRATMSARRRAPIPMICQATQSGGDLGGW